jgi:hypothetical protein
MRVGRGASRTKNIRMASAVKNSVAVIRDSGDPYATETFMRLFFQELSNNPPASTASSAAPVFGAMGPRRPPRR